MSGIDEAVARDLIAEIRRTSGMTQAELARRSGLQSSVLSAYAHGHRQPSVAALARIASAAGMELQLALAPDSIEAQEHAGQVLAQVIDLAEALPYRPRDELAYPPLTRLRPGASSASCCSQSTTPSSGRRSPTRSAVPSRW